jgi:hypothetical protein
MEDYFFIAKTAFLRGFGDSKFDDSLGWNFDLLLRLWVKAHARFSLLLHQLAEIRHDKIRRSFNFFVGNRAEHIEEYSSGSKRTALDLNHQNSHPVVPISSARSDQIHRVLSLVSALRIRKLDSDCQATDQSEKQEQLLRAH